MLRGFRPPIVSSGCSKLHRFIIGNGSRECDHEGTHSRFIIAITDTSRDAQASMEILSQHTEDLQMLFQLRGIMVGA